MRTGKANQKGLSSRRHQAKRQPCDRADSPTRTGAGWRLPSGEGLTEFALSAGFLATFLMDGKQIGTASRCETNSPESPESVGVNSMGGHQ